jgi:polyhydroxybutyrate depolymerase
MRNYAGFEQAIASSLPGGAIVVYPNGSGAEEGLPQSWNAGDCCPFAIYDLVDDVAFFDELITKLVGEFDIDERHVWSVGHSNGGMMSYRLGCELSGRITAIGVAAGALTVSSCTPDSAVSALHIHGDLDAVVPINGGEFAGITFPSAQVSFEKYASAVNCSVNESIATCPEGTSVSLVTNSAWTHDWQPEWTGLIVDFLAERRAR